MKTLAGALCSALLLLIAVPAQSDPFEDGYAAYAKRDYSSAIKQWSIGAERGDARSQFLLATMYESGKGVAADRARAFELYSKAAEKGVVDAQFRLGYMETRAARPPAEQSAGVIWLERAAARGHGMAMESLATCYALGRGAPKNESQALVWLNLAIVRLRIDEPASAELQTALQNRKYLQFQLSGDEQHKAEAQSDEWTRKLPPLQKTIWEAPPGAQTTHAEDFAKVKDLAPYALAAAGTADKNHYLNYFGGIAAVLVANKTICIPPTMSVLEVASAVERDVALMANGKFNDASASVYLRIVLKREFPCDSSRYKYW